MSRRAKQKTLLITTGALKREVSTECDFIGLTGEDCTLVTCPKIGEYYNASSQNRQKSLFYVLS